MSFKPFLAYSASAGSGKTFALAVRYISLLFMGESPASILAATFTNKAAAEMRQRVVDSLRDIGRDEAFLAAIVEQTGLEREALLRKQPEVLARFLSSSTFIVTLDSFFSSILRSASLELGLEPDFVTKEAGSEALEKHFLDEVQHHGLLSSLVTLAIHIEDKRFGKIFDQMQNLYRIDPLLPAQHKTEISISQCEKVCEALRLEMLKALAEAGAAPRCINQFETTQTKELFAKALFQNEYLGDHSWFKKSVNDEIEAIYAKLKASLNLWIKAKEAVILENLFNIYDAYKNATVETAKSSGVLSFDDLAYFTYRLLHESISKEFLYFKIDAKFRHILLDEFQDTSTLQFLLLEPLIDEIFAGKGQSEFKSFFYVGDTKQSLYRFRGGVEELFDRVAQRYGIAIEPMDTNYRSSKHVVEQVNRWFTPIIEGYVPQKSKTGASEGYVEVLESQTVVDEAIMQAQKLLAMGVNVDEIAFLVSANKDGQQLQEACEAVGIETVLRTSSSLKSVPKIAALVGMLTYLYDKEKIDAEALLARVGKSINEISLHWYHPFMEPFAILDRLVREFGYFEGDKNILKLLEFAATFTLIADFLEEFEQSRIAVAEHSVHGANIMTIHGSKGLEFGYVIVLDKLTGSSPERSPLLFDFNDALYVERVWYKTQSRDHFDRDYANLLGARKEAVVKDRKNLLYVALTRAVEALIVIRKEKDSIFDEAGIMPMCIGRLQIDGVQTPKIEEVAQKRKVTLSHYGTQETPKESQEEEKEYAAILFGTALHYTLEMLQAFDGGSLKTALIAVQNRYGHLLESAQIEQIRMRIERLIANNTFQTMLVGAKIGKERALSFNGELKQIDLLLEYKEKCIVVDYKSSTKYRLKHQEQVAQYQNAIGAITGKPTEGRIIYLLEDSIIIKEL